MRTQGGGKPSEVYLKAAELIASDSTNRACYAIQFVCGLDNHGYGRNPVVQQYRDDVIGTLITSDLYPDWENTKRAQKVRVLSLLFAHHIARDSERGEGKSG